jgi:hypothetical protein
MICEANRISTALTLLTFPSKIWHKVAPFADGFGTTLAWLEKAAEPVFLGVERANAASE